MIRPGVACRELRAPGDPVSEKIDRDRLFKLFNQIRNLYPAQWEQQPSSARHGVDALPASVVVQKIRSILAASPSSEFLNHKRH
jgi:hypothetical protein